MLGVDLVLLTLHGRLQLVLSKTNRIGDTKYNVQCSSQFQLASDFYMDG